MKAPVKDCLYLISKSSLRPVADRSRYRTPPDNIGSSLILKCLDRTPLNNDVTWCAWRPFRITTGPLEGDIVEMIPNHEETGEIRLIVDLKVGYDDWARLGYISSTQLYPISRDTSITYSINKNAKRDKT